MFKNVIYAKTRLEFEEHQELFEGAEVSKKYPHYLAHVTKDYGYRVETWTTYFRIENELPTRGSNTNNYCESSMRLTKEKVFSRIRTFNLSEMLSVICDNSASYANKLVDIGDGRDTALKQGKSKYLEKISTIRKEDIVDLGDSKLMVESENSKNTFYTCDMLSGYCSCPMGSTHLVNTSQQ